MHRRFDMSSLFLTVAYGVISGPIAHAQTCAAPVVWTPSSSGVPALVVDLCALSDSVALYCDFLDSAGKNDAIYQLTLPPGFTGTEIDVSGSTATFNPVIFLYNGACATGSGCVASGDATNPLEVAGLAPGTYFFAVSAAPTDATNACGTAVVDTNLPVELQTFQID